MAVFSRDLARDMEEEMTDEKPKLSKADEVFVSEYLLSFNATLAYKKAHPSAKDTTAASNGWKLLRKTEIREAIQSRLDEVHMSADEALKLLSDIARGDVGDFVNDFGGVDILKARERGLTRLIKKVRTKTITINGKDEDKEIVDEEIELYPADAALDKILKVHKKYSDAPTVNINMSWKDFISGIDTTASDK